MKILSLLIFAFAISLSASAQKTIDSTHHNRSHEQFSKMKNHEHYIMQNGKLMSDKNGTRAEVNNVVTLRNGTIITPDGKVTWKNGKTQTLQNGEMIDMKGDIHQWNNQKMHKKTMTHHRMDKKTDSTKQ